MPARAAADPPQLGPAPSPPRGAAPSSSKIASACLDALRGQRASAAPAGAPRPRAEERAGALEGPGWIAVDRRAQELERRERGVEIAFGRGEQSAAAQRSSRASGLSSRSTVAVYCSRYARAWSISPRAASVSIGSAQTGNVGSFIPPATSRSGSSRRCSPAASRLPSMSSTRPSTASATFVYSSIESAGQAREPPPPSRAPRRRDRDRPRSAPSPGRPRTGRADAAFATVSSYATCARLLARSCPAPGEPLDHGERPEGQHAAHLVASLLRLGLELLEDGAGSIECRPSASGDVRARSAG